MRFVVVKVEPFHVLKVANLEMSWSSVVRLMEVKAFKALKARNKWVSFLIFEL